MPITCADCGTETSEYVTKLVMSTGQFRSTCKICEHPVHSSECVNVFADLTLDHVHDEQGRPLRVTSVRQLREAEKKYHFRSLVAHENEANFDKPPQQQTGTVFDVMTREKRWLYPDTVKSLLEDCKRNHVDISTW